MKRFRRAPSLRELGMHRLRDLSRPEEVFQLVHPELESEFPPLAPLDRCPNNLPVQLTSFVGRGREIAEVRRLLGSARMVTLTGMGGCGKTRLSLQVAGELLDTYRDGVWLIELGPVDRSEMVVRTLAAVLGLREEGDRPLAETIAGSLETRTVLLLLDNCEHLVEECAEMAGTLLRRCPALRILTTSREALGVPGEVVWELPPLPVPEPPAPGAAGVMDAFSDCPAVRLFLDRAVTAAPAFALSAQSAPYVAEICRRLEGLPLAIELAAARVRLISVQEISTRLDDCLRLLAVRSTTLPQRQQTLRGAVDWSYNLLGEAERLLFRRLSVFAGGFTLNAAEHVCADEAIDSLGVLDLLGRLVDKSLVRVEERDCGETHYRLLEVLRQYAQERLAESDDCGVLRTRHLRFYLDRAEEAEDRLSGPEQAAYLGCLDSECDNFRAALAWSLTSPAAAGLRLAGALWRFWYTRGWAGEGRRWLADLLAASADRTLERARALYGAGVLANSQSDYAAAAPLLDESLQIYRELDSQSGVADALNGLGIMAYYQGDYDTARARYDEALVLKRSLGDLTGASSILNNLGILADGRGDFAAARALYEESLSARRELGGPIAIANSLNNLAFLLNRVGEHDRSRTLYEESLAIAREMGSQRGIATALHGLATAARDGGDRTTARRRYAESVGIQRVLGDRRAIAECLDGLATLACLEGRADEAVRLSAAAQSMRTALGVTPEPSEQVRHQSMLQDARDSLGTEAFEAAWAEGSEASPEEAVALACGADEQ